MDRAPNAPGDTRHLWIVLFLILGGLAVAVPVRSALVPASFGELGPYRADALDQLKALPSILQGDATCVECHEEVKAEWEEAAHVKVSCIHCHGIGRQHVAQARQAKATPGAKVDPAAAWDGDFKTKVDLYIARHRNVCLACHELVVGKPDEFLTIDVAEHLEDTEAEKPDNPNVCLECHGAHDTAPK